MKKQRSVTDLEEPDVQLRDLGRLMVKQPSRTLNLIRLHKLLLDTNIGRIYHTQIYRSYCEN